MRLIRFWVSGIPRPAGSKRAFTNPRTGRAMIVDASGSNGVKWRKAVQRAAAEEIWRCGWQITPSAVALYLEFHMERPKSHHRKLGLKPTAPQYHTQKPDATKLVRSVEDSLTGILWQDDAQVVRQEVRKVWVTGSPGVWVCVQVLDEDGALDHVRD